MQEGTEQPIKQLECNSKHSNASKDAGPHENDGDERPQHPPALWWTTSVTSANICFMSTADRSACSIECKSVGRFHLQISANFVASLSFTFLNTRSSKMSHTLYIADITLHNHMILHWISSSSKMYSHPWPSYMRGAASCRMRRAVWGCWKLTQ
jgi:hypothetical protein